MPNNQHTASRRRTGLYRPEFEHDSCGVGFVAHIKGKRSHQIVLDADHLLCRMDHRGARGAEPNTGDGAGILTALPHEFLAKVAQREFGAELPPAGKFAAGIVFLPTDAAEREHCKEVVAEICAEEGQTLVGWRIVPTRPKRRRHRRRRARGDAAHRAAVRRGRRRASKATRSNASSI